MKVILVMSFLGAALVLAAVAWGTGNFGIHRNESSSSIKGLQILLTLGELTQASDLVVVGKSLSSARGEVRPVDDPSYSEHLLDSTESIAIKRVTFEVDEYIKGVGPEQITVLTSANSEGVVFGGSQQDSDVLTKDTEYLLFLFEPDVKAVWGDGYIIQGPQGRWVIEEGTANRASPRHPCQLRTSKPRFLPLSPKPRLHLRPHGYALRAFGLDAEAGGAACEAGRFQHV